MNLRIPGLQVPDESVQ